MDRYKLHLNTLAKRLKKIETLARTTLASLSLPRRWGTLIRRRSTEDNQLVDKHFTASLDCQSMLSMIVTVVCRSVDFVINFWTRID